MSSKEIKLCVPLAGEMIEIGKVHLVDDEYAVVLTNNDSYFSKMIDAQLGSLVPKQFLKENLRKKAEEAITDPTGDMQENLYKTMFERN